MTPAIRALESAGVEYSVHEYEHTTDGQDYGLDAARQLGLDPPRVFKTLLVTASGVDARPAVAVVPVSGRLSLKAIARELGEKAVSLCDPGDAERITGYVVGGISPFGQKRRLRTVLDVTAIDFERIYVSGGRRGLDIGIAPADLISVLDAATAPVGVG